MFIEACCSGNNDDSNVSGEEGSDGGGLELNICRLQITECQYAHNYYSSFILRFLHLLQETL